MRDSARLPESWLLPLTLRPARGSSRSRAMLPLMNGDHLTSTEFLRRAEAMPDVKKIELIEGTVYMPSPIHAESHGIPDTVLQFWLNSFILDRPSLQCFSTTTFLLDEDNTLQPDIILCSAPKPGGRVWLNAKGYLCGAPELVCEISATSASIDLHKKLHAHRRHGVQEYLVWLTLEKRVRWFQLVDGEYLDLRESRGRIESRIFPGLVLGMKALLKLDRRGLLAGLQKRKK